MLIRAAGALYANAYKNTAYANAYENLYRPRTLHRIASASSGGRQPAERRVRIGSLCRRKPAAARTRLFAASSENSSGS